MILVDLYYFANNLVDICGRNQTLIVKKSKNLNLLYFTPIDKVLSYSLYFLKKVHFISNWTAQKHTVSITKDNVY